MEESACHTAKALMQKKSVGGVRNKRDSQPVDKIVIR